MQTRYYTSLNSKILLSIKNKLVFLFNFIIVHFGVNLEMYVDFFFIFIILFVFLLFVVFFIFFFFIIPKLCSKIYNLRSIFLDLFSISCLFFDILYCFHLPTCANNFVLVLLSFSLMKLSSVISSLSP